MWSDPTANTSAADLSELDSNATDAGDNVHSPAYSGLSSLEPNSPEFYRNESPPTTSFTAPTVQDYYGNVSNEGLRLASLFPSTTPGSIVMPYESTPAASTMPTFSGYSTEGEKLECQPDPDNYFTYPKLAVNHQHQLIVFYIEGETRDGVMYPDPKAFVVKVFGPTGKSCHIALRLDPLNSGRHMCTFHAKDSGAYTIWVQLWHRGVQHVYGSPFDIFVTRNYYAGRPHVMLGYRGIRYSEELRSACARPGCIDVDRFSDRIYLTDKETHSVRIFAVHNGYQLAEIKMGGRQEGYFFRPTGIAVDRVNKRIIVSDKDNHRISFCDLDGQYIRSFGRYGHQPGEFYYPWGVAVSPNGELIAVADSKNHRLQLFDKSGNYLNMYCSFEINQSGYKKDFDSPRSVCFDNSGTRIYVSDFTRQSVDRFDLQLTTKFTLIGDGRLSHPQGITTDEAGNILICDGGNECIRVITPHGTTILNIFGNVTFRKPQDIAVLGAGRLLVILDSEGKIHAY